MRNIPKHLNTPETPQPTKPIKTLIITDYMGWSGATPEEEAEQIANNFIGSYGITLDYQHHTFVPSSIDSGVKLIIMDYGGVLPGADDMVVAQIRHLCEWAELHPSKLLLIYTAFTSRFYHFDLEDRFGELPNILHWEPVDENGYRVSMHWEDRDASHDKIAGMIKLLGLDQ